MSTGPSHLSKSHPVAEAANRLCASSHPNLGGGRIGNVACGKCWEAAIRADERWIIEAGDGAPTAAPVLDHIAIDLAMSGKQVKLTTAERREAARRMIRRGFATTVVCTRLKISGAYLQDALDEAAHAMAVAG